MAFQGDSIYWVEVEKVVPNPFQPRREFDQNKLQELADSIRMYGVLQPLTVTRNEIQQDNGTFYTEYELIAGERRLRASKLAGVAQVPVIIREGEQSQQEKLELAIIENLQREDLNAVDRAIAFRQLADVFGLSHAQVAQKVGRSREYVSNSIRLLGLPEHMLTSLKHSEMMEGHARTLLMLTDRPEEQEVVYKEILLKKLSVREVERIVRKIATDKVRKKNPGEFDANLIEFEKKFTETLGTRVQIQKTDFGGKLTIDYFSEDDLEAILKRMHEEATEAEPTQNEVVERLAEHTPLVMTPQSEVSTPAPEPEPEISAPQTYYPHLAPQQAPVVTPAPIPTPVPTPTDYPAESNESPRVTPSEVFVHAIPSVQHSAPEQIAENNSIDSLPAEPALMLNENIAPELVSTPTPEPTPEPTLSQSENKDESGLYSIRNFNV